MSMLIRSCRSVLSQLTTPTTRSDVLAWYVTTSTFGSSLGSEASGRLIGYLRDGRGWAEIEVYHYLFWIYSAMGIVNAVLVLLLTAECEMEASNEKDSYAEVPQEESHHATSQNNHNDPADIEASLSDPARSWFKRLTSWLTSGLSQISASTRSVMYKLWVLLMLDCLADGMVPYSLTNYYLNDKFHPSLSALGDVTSISYFLGAIGAVFAGPLARKIGLINTMVFTHVPSSAAVLFFPSPPYFWMASALLLVRAGLNNMDQAPRTAFIAAVVKPEERTAVMGITTMLRTLAAMSGPTVTGFLASSNRFWIAFVAAGFCRLAYDFGLYALFVDMKLHEHEKDLGRVPRDSSVVHADGDEEELEMRSLASSDDGRGDVDDDVGDLRSKGAAS